MILGSSAPPGRPGSKPRASGDDPEAKYQESSRNVVNPARAGMIRLMITPADAANGKPRASGDDPAVRNPLHRNWQ